MKSLCSGRWNIPTSSCWSRRWTLPLNCTWLWSWWRCSRGWGGSGWLRGEGSFLVLLCKTQLSYFRREAIYLTPSPPRPNTQRETPVSWCTTSPERWSTYTAWTSSTETLNQRIYWYAFTNVLCFGVGLTTNPDPLWALNEYFILGFWVPRWHQITETWRLWPSYCSRGPLVYCMWHSYICGSRNHRWVRVSWTLWRNML